MGLFDQSPPPSGPSGPAASDERAPLAERMRPRTLDELVGHRAVLGPGTALRRAIEEDRLPSIVLWGPPGCGKTTVARLIAERSRARFVPFSAVTSGVREARSIMETAEREARATGRRTILFVDEIHRFNRAQQDAFLPWVERGTIALIGATTENPSFEINAALLSRLRVHRLERLADEDLVDILRRALGDAERGLGEAGVAVAPERLATIARHSAGDARRALNVLEAAVAAAASRGEDDVDDDGLRDALQRETIHHDREEHFNLVSALQKSIRNSDPDAAVYWLARMLRAGEDPLYVARRLVRIASEDVGLADSRALGLTIDARRAVETIGLPEGALALAQAAIFCALAPKSSSVEDAWLAANEAIDGGADDPVPLALRNAVTSLMREQGYGRGYVSAHERGEPVAELDCLPERLRGTRFYRPGERGAERDLAERLRRILAGRREG